MKTVKIKRIGVLSLAKLYAVVMALFGLVVGVIYGGVLMLVGLVAGAAQQQGQGAAPAWVGGAGIMVGLLMIVFMPVIYGLMGFIGGALAAWFYNLAAGVVGGIELELEPSVPAGLQTVTETY